MNISIDYIAGIIDGEGCFNISHLKGPYRGSIIISNTDGDALLLLYENSK